MKPIVALVGRPNVGKSTLFNRITRTRAALVDDFPGVTRDRHFGDAVWEEAEFTLVDTGGFVTAKDADEFAPQVRQQVVQALADAHAVVMVLDGKSGISPFDQELIAMLRPAAKPVLYVVNKIDHLGEERRLDDFYELGIDPLYPVSAEHGYGVADFLDELVRSLPSAERPAAPAGPEPVKLAVVGRPNVGKSSLVNRIVGENRLVVSDVPGTTRDSIDTRYERDGRTYLLVDTAGIRRKARVSRKLEKFSVIKALHSLERCDVALIVLDAHEGVTDQDIKIAGYAFERGCGCIFLLNKWDLVEKDDKVAKRFMEALRDQARFLQFAPVLTISALTGLRIGRIFQLVDRIFTQYTARITTGQLNRILERAVARNDPPLHRGRRIKFFYMTQTGVKPPTFVGFVNYPEAVHFSYKRYLLNQIRSEADLAETPLKLLLRKRERRQIPGG